MMPEFIEVATKHSDISAFLFSEERSRTFYDVRVHRGGEEKLGHLGHFEDYPMKPTLSGSEEKVGHFMTYYDIRVHRGGDEKLGHLGQFTTRCHEVTTNVLNVSKPV
jgi:hypothetical protein